MKSQLLILYILFLSNTLFAQNISRPFSTLFTYDGNGNMISRKKMQFYIPSSKNEQPNKDISSEINVVHNGDSYTIYMSKNYGNTVTMHVYDTSPIVVKNEKFIGMEHTFNLKGNPNGIYILKVNVENMEGIKKIIKN